MQHLQLLCRHLAGMQTATYTPALGVVKAVGGELARPYPAWLAALTVKRYTMPLGYVTNMNLRCSRNSTLPTLTICTRPNQSAGRNT